MSPGTWVEVEQVVLDPGERAPTLPEDTREVPYVLRVSGFLLEDAGLGEPARRAVGFAGVTRNSLVVLPLALALPAGFEVAPFAVVTQTMVELLVMVALVWLGRRVPARTAAGPGVLPCAAAPTISPQESRHASSRLCPGVDPAPGPGANN